MAEPESLVLELLRAIRGDIAGINERLNEVQRRQNDTHLAVLSLRRDQTTDAEAVAHVQARMDRFGERLERIERRLDIVG